MADVSVKRSIGDSDFTKHPISDVHKMTTSANAHVWNDAFRSSVVLKDVLIYCDLLFSLVPPFSFSMGPVDPSVENPTKNIAF